MFGGTLTERLLATASATLSRNADDVSTLAGIDSAMVVADALAPDQPLIFANKAFCDLTGYTLEEIIGRNCRFLQGEATDTADRERFRQGIASQAPFRVTLLNYRKDGTPFYNQVFISPVRNADDRVVRIVGMQIPVEAPMPEGHAQASAAEAEAALRELRHRFKNHIQALTSLVSLQARRVTGSEAGRALEDLHARFETLASIYTDLDEPGVDEADLDQFLPPVISKIAYLYDPSGRVSLKCDITPVRVVRRRAALLGQITSELIMNAYRHAFAERGTGLLEVTVRPLGPGEMELCVTDDGPGPVPADPSRPHLGLGIVASLARSMGGAFSSGSGERGYRASIRFPLLHRPPGE
jgi:PAS domain S-box-containing protein